MYINNPLILCMHPVYIHKPPSLNKRAFAVSGTQFLLGIVRNRNQEISEA